MINPWRFFVIFIGLLSSAAWVIGVLLIIFGILSVVLTLGEMRVANSPVHDFWVGLYLSAITALTIGYGDVYPHSALGKTAAIGLGILGIVFTGIVVAAAIKALERVTMREIKPHDG